MDEKRMCRRLRHEINKVGITMLVYYSIMSAVVGAVMMIQMVYQMLIQPDISEDALANAVISNGWGYMISIAIGVAIMLLWKKREFCFRTIWKTNQPMRFGSFWAILCVFLSGQLLAQLYAIFMEFLANLLGFSVMESIEIASNIGDTFSMFVYGCLFAPIFEEVLFRGLLLRMLEPLGKKFAIFTSALLFGIFHANVVQTPFAFLVGLVLGYVAMEYSMAWAMVLHMINNLVLGDMLTRLTSSLPEAVSTLIFYLVIGAATLAAIVICICKRRDIKAYLTEKKIHPWSMHALVTSPAIIIFFAMMLGNMALTMVMQFFS